MSNLAVLIDDMPGKEAQCDRLFSVAVKLARPGSRVPFFHTEFLLDVLDEEVRRERLVAARYEGNEAKINASASESLAKLKDDDLLEPTDRLYRDVLKLRIDWREKKEDRETPMSAAWKLAKTHAQVLLGGGREPSSRLNDLLDSLVGKGGAYLAAKEPLQGVVWAAQIEVGQPGWPMATQIANDLVGESSANSQEEVCGLGLNAMLAADADLLRAGEGGARIAAIWSQSGALLSRRIGKPAASRVALAFLASLAHGGGAQSFDRMRQSAKRLGLSGDGGRSEEWSGLLDDVHQAAFLAYAADPRDAAAARMLADIVFGTDYPRIGTPEELAERMKWRGVALEWADGKDFDAAVNDLVAAFHPTGAKS